MPEPSSQPEAPGAGRIAVFAYRDDIDIATAEAFQAAALAAVPQTARAAVLDLSGVRYVDSAGIRALLSIAERLAHRRQQIRLVLHPGSGVQRLLEIAALDATLPAHDSVEAALEAVGA